MLERQEALLAWEERLDTRSQQLEQREKESQDKAATLATLEEEIVVQHAALLE